MPGKSDVRKRDVTFAPKLETSISCEHPHPSNPFLVEEKLIYGFEHFELIDKVSFSDMIFLLIKGELPSGEQSKLFAKLAVAFCDPGIRHAASQAAMASGAGRTDRLHILPISLGVFSGAFDAAGNLETLVKQFTEISERSPEEILLKIRKNELQGFGTLYGDKDPYAEKLFNYFCKVKFPYTLLSTLAEVNSKLIAENINIGITKQGLVAVILYELGFSHRQCGPVFQLLSAPGLLAYGLEYSSKPMNAMLFESDEQYEWQK